MPPQRNMFPLLLALVRPVPILGDVIKLGEDTWTRLQESGLTGSANGRGSRGRGSRGSRASAGRPEYSAYDEYNDLNSQGADANQEVGGGVGFQKGGAEEDADNDQEDEGGGSRPMFGGAGRRHKAFRKSYF